MSFTSPTSGSRGWSAAAVGVAAIILLWWAAALALDASIILPTPWETVLSLASELRSDRFAGHVGATLARTLAGFGAAFAVGVAWGVIGDRASRVLRPALVLIRATPVIAVILLALIWFRSSLAPLFVTWLMVLPVVVENVTAGRRAASGHLLEMAELFGVPHVRRLRLLTIPALRPFLFAAAHSGLGMAFKVTVAAEVLVQPPWALGGAMQEARFYLDTPRIIALTLTVIVLSAVAEALLGVLERLFPGVVARGGRARMGAGRDVVEWSSEPAGEDAVVLAGVCHGYGDRLVLDELSLTFRRGEVGVVLGPSGCGKTTLLRLIAGLERQEAGSIMVTSPPAIAFQEPRLLPWAQAAANLDFVVGPYHEDASDRWLAAVGLGDRAHDLPSSLSGGMQQRLNLARALVQDRPIVLLDEPFQNLDLAIKLDLARLLRSERRRPFATTVMVTHDVVEALAAGDRIVILAGAPARVIADVRVSLNEPARDPRHPAHQREAARLYDALLSAT